MGYGNLITTIDLEMSEQSKQFLGYMVEAADEMNTLISDILDLEQLRSNQAPREVMDLGVAIQQVVKRYEPDIIRKEQILETQIDENIQVMGNYSQLSQVLSNLVSNAVKYTPDKGILTVRLHTNEKRAHFEVEDTGYGIPKEAQAKLFSEFYRVKTEATAHISGTGLGLSLVKSVVEAHEGKIWFESTEGKGSTFFVEFPLVN
jgi:signal transduction histidine kinase